MFYGEVFKALNKAKIKYVVAGGTAVILHGYKRLTEDLDLVVYMKEDNLEKFFTTLGKIGYMPKVPVTKEQFKSKKERERWKKEKGMIVFSFVQKDPPFRLIDIFVNEPIRFDLLYKNRVKVRVGGVSIPIISISHLVKLKERAARPVDLEDIVQLKEIKRLTRKRK